ncbi:MAG TPA: hypothetical protein VNR18_05020 [Hyphomicrobiales bacterium]|nr:hypothetical protein [Hyphomicrobiales bacterium]
MTDCFFLDTANLDFLTLTGPDATRFLQGQLTCNVEALAVNALMPGAALNNKGRIYATFFLVRLDDAYVIVLHKGLGAVFLAQLRKYLPFYKCQFTEGAHGADPLLVVGAEPAALPLPEPTPPILTIGTAPVAANLLWLSPQHAEALRAQLRHGSDDDWFASAMLLGHYPFTEADVEQYTPGELRLEHHGYVSFDKGCYTGQEIVARMHYRGKTKKQLCRLDLGGTADPLALTLRDAEGAALGTPFKAIPLGADTWRALSFLPLDFVDTNTLPVADGATVSACEAL